MKKTSNLEKRSHKQLKHAWLLTLECLRDESNDKVVAIFSPSLGVDTVKKFIEQYYVARFSSFYEQIAYTKSKSSIPFKVQNATAEISESLQKALSLKSLPVGASMIIGDTPYLWARIVHSLETWIDQNGVEHLKWDERENLSWEDGEIKSDLKTYYIKRGI